jgi:AcrR family transcriptional regulator
VSADPAGPGTPSRRERQRAATLAEILDRAYALLTTGGPAAVSLRAVARDMGMTPAALYRYVPSVAGLVSALSARLCDDARQAVLRAGRAAAPAGSATCAAAMCTAFRDWATSHPAEFAVLFGGPPPGDPRPSFLDGPCLALLATFAELLGGAAEPAALFPCWVRLYGLVSLEVAGHLGAPDGPAGELAGELATAELAAVARAFAAAVSGQCPPSGR